jgi:hypothetical protein
MEGGNVIRDSKGTGAAQQSLVFERVWYHRRGSRIDLTRIYENRLSPHNPPWVDGIMSRGLCNIGRSPDAGRQIQNDDGNHRHFLLSL